MKRMLTSCFGLGFVPFASGTFGSMPTAIIFAILCFAGLHRLAISFAMLIIAAIFSFACIKFGDEVIKIAGKDDPSEIVADETAGQAITFLGIAATGTSNILIISALGFFIFRFFDILKPQPCRKLESLHGGVGVLADDLMAGIYSCIVLQIGIWLYQTGALTHISNDITVTSAALLGAVQGLTEFLPVSSSGHLVLFEHVLNLDPETPQMLIFDLITHVGTVVAILIIFRQSIVGFVKNLFEFKRYGNTPLEIHHKSPSVYHFILKKISTFITIYRRSPSIHFLMLAIISTFITGVLGIAFEKFFLDARGNLPLVCVMWLITGTVLLITDYKKETRMGLRKMTILCAVVIGLAQAFAIFPGISRSGSTICAAVLLGLHRRWAIEYSFLLAMPAILGGTLITLIKDFDMLTTSSLSPMVLITGAISACVVGILALKLLIGFSKKKNFKIFAIYCYLLALTVGTFLIFNK